LGFCAIDMSGVVDYWVHYRKNNGQSQIQVALKLKERSRFPQGLPNDGNMYRQGWQTDYLNPYKFEILQLT